MHLVKDFTAEHACNEVEFYMGMVADDQQTFEGLIQHLKNAFQSGETTSELISNFYGRAQKKNESEEAFADELQILVCKIIARSRSSERMHMSSSKVNSHINLKIHTMLQ